MHTEPAQRNSQAGHSEPPKPSALMVATLRAAHQLLDTPLVFDDPLALKTLGPDREQALRANPEQYSDSVSTAIRTTLVVRSRLAEDEWAQASQRGVRQCVILGAGLDTFAYRHADAPGVRVFEVDLPSTQQWKRDCLRAAGIAEPATLTYVPVDFDTESLADSLAGAGFRCDEPAFFSWLGVALYLSEEDVMRTLRFIASCAPASTVVFDYAVDPHLLGILEWIGVKWMSLRFAARGEPWKSAFDPDKLAAAVRELGFGEVRNFSTKELHERYLAGRSDGLYLRRVVRMMAATV
jgi:methyltransferase (TIGR00027 family)